MSTFLHKSTILLFIFFPIGLSFFVQQLYIFRIWNSYIFWLIGFVAFLVLSSLGIFLYQSHYFKYIESKHLFLVIGLVTLGVGLRVILLPVINTSFISDMKDVHLFAMDVVAGNPTANLQNYTNIPRSTYLNMSGLVLANVYKIFSPSSLTAKMCMVFLAGLTTGLIYWSGLKLASSRVGIMAALIFAIFPSLVLYTGVVSGEHVAIFLLTAIIVLYLKIHESRNKKVFYFIGYLFCGGIIGLVDWFRPVGFILCLSIFIADLLYTEKGGYLNTFIPLAGLLISYLFVSALPVHISERVFGVDILSPSQRSGHFLLVGLNPDTAGAISSSDNELTQTVYEHYGDDHLSAQRYLLQLALKRLKGHSVFIHFWLKFDRIWANQDELFTYSLAGSDGQEFVMHLEYLEAFLYLMITFYVSIRSARSFFHRSKPAVFVMQLFILFFSMLLLLGEAQNRYAIVIFPYLILLGALGLEDHFRKTTNLRVPHKYLNYNSSI